MASELRIGDALIPERAQLDYAGLWQPWPAAEPRVWGVTHTGWAGLLDAMTAHVQPQGGPEWQKWLALRHAATPQMVLVPEDVPFMHARMGDGGRWKKGPTPEVRVANLGRVQHLAARALSEWTSAEAAMRRALSAIAEAAEAGLVAGTPVVAREVEDLLAGWPPDADRVDAALAELRNLTSLSRGGGWHRRIPGLGFWRTLSPADQRRLRDGLGRLEGDDGVKMRQVEAELLRPLDDALGAREVPGLDIAPLDRALPRYLTLPWLAGAGADAVRARVLDFADRKVPADAPDRIGWATLRVLTSWPGAAPYFIARDWREADAPPPPGATPLHTPGDDLLFTTLGGAELDALLAEGLIRRG